MPSSAPFSLEPKTIDSILILWQTKTPTKTIAAALGMPYAHISTLTRSFKVMYSQFSDTEIVNNTLAQYASHASSAPHASSGPSLQQQSPLASEDN